MLLLRSGTAALAFTLLAGTAPLHAQVTGDDCGTLAAKYDEYVKTADSLVTDLVGKALDAANPAEVLGQMGLDTKGMSPEQAAQKGAVAAISPPAQNAIMIYLLRANTAMQALVWKGCKPPQ